MVRKLEACAECTHNCQLIHLKMRDPSSIVTSFFKVLIGDNYSKCLFLPPKFARTMSALVDQETDLEDSSGWRCKVTLSSLDGSLAFQKGWHQFSLAHGLKVGDFLVFNYIKESHFVVQIYGKSGCQKLNFFEENGNRKKRSRTHGIFFAKDGPCQMIDSSSMHKQGSSTSVVSGSDTEISQSQPMAMGSTANFDKGLQLVSATKSVDKYIEEPFYMIDREAEYKQGEGRSCLYDLSTFETQSSRYDTDGTNKVFVGDDISPHSNTILKSKTEAIVVDKDLVAVEVAMSVSPSKVGDFAMIEKNDDSLRMDNVVHKCEKGCDSGHSSGHHLETSALKAVENRNDSMSRIAICQNADRSNTHSSEKKVAKKELVEMSDLCSFEEMLRGKEPKMIDKCGQSSSLAAKDNNKVFKVVKTEPVDSFDFSSPDAANISGLAVMGSQAFCELSTCLPSISFRRTKLERKVVLLRGSDTRLWPVLYHQKCGLKVLTSGWEAFIKANSIQPGPECVFGLENELESIYRVSISP